MKKKLPSRFFNIICAGLLSLVISVAMANTGRDAPPPYAASNFVVVAGNSAAKPLNMGFKVQEARLLLISTQSLTITSASTLAVDDQLSVSAVRSVSPTLGGELLYSLASVGTASATVDLSGNLTAVSAGNVILTVTAVGDTYYLPASASQLITISKGTPTLAITSANTMMVDGMLPTVVTTTASQGIGALNYSVVNGSGAGFVFPSGVISAISAGGIILTVSSAGNSDYNPASVSKLIAILPGTPVLTITAANTMDLGGSLTPSVNTTATYGRGGLLSFSLGAGSGSATVNPNTGFLTALGAGTITLIATSAGDVDYNPASVSKLIAIGQAILTIISGNTLAVDGTSTAAVTTTATVSSGGAITFNVLAGSGSATVNSNTGLVTGIGAGTVTLVATSAGDTNYAIATTSQLLTINKTTPTLTFTSANSMYVDQSLTSTVVTTATGGRGGAISFAIIGGSGSATVNSSTGFFTAIGAGFVLLRATSTGDTDYNMASATQLITIGKTTPTLTFTSPTSMYVDGALTATVETTATDGSGGAISFVILGGSGSATVNANTGRIVATGVGNLLLRATSAGDTSYYSASVIQLITIGQATQTLIITSANTMIVDGILTASVSTTATNGGAISYAIVNGIGSAIVDSSTGVINALSAGQVTLTVTSLGDTNYVSATASQLITIGKATPTLTFISTNAMPVYGSLTATVNTTATFSRGGSITFALSLGSGVATINSNTGFIYATSSGTATLVVTAAGDSDYNGATASQLITISKITPILTITSPNTVSVGGTLTSSVTISAITGLGGVISFTIGAGSGSATVNPSTGVISAIGAGTVTLMVASAGDTNYNPATASQVVTVYQTTPALTITSANTMVVDGTLTATVTSSVGNPGTISYSIINGTGSAVVNTSTGFIKAIQQGTVTLIAFSSGNTNYAPAFTSQVITINKVTPILTITSANTMLVSNSLTASVTTTATLGRGGAITFGVVAGSGSATVNSNTGLITAIAPGTVALIAASAGDTDYYPAFTNQLITINPNTPVLTITSANTLVVDGTLTATVISNVSNPGTISYSIVNGTGYGFVNPSTGLIKAIQAGTITLFAVSLGNSIYTPAFTSQLITIGKAIPILTITSPNAINNVGGTLSATTITSATGGRGGVITYTISAGSGSATVNSVTGLVTAVATGTVVLTAYSAGDADYYAASTSQLIVIGRASQILTISSANTMVVDGTLTATVTSTASNGGTISYSIVNGTGSAVVNSSTGFIRAIQRGTVTLIATSSGNTYYFPSTTSQVITINKATPILTITSHNIILINTSMRAAVTTTATLGRGGVISYSINLGTGLAFVNPSTGLITAIAPGTVMLIATSAGDANYNSATTSQVITIVSSMFADVPPVDNPGLFTPEINPNTNFGEGKIDQGIVVPKVYSPNGDSFNDSFTIQNIYKYLDNELVIANRNGEVVYKAHRYDNDTVAFVGKSNTGAELMDGTYYYLLTFYDQGRLSKYVGFFKLSR